LRQAGELESERVDVDLLEPQFALHALDQIVQGRHRIDCGRGLGRGLVEALEHDRKYCRRAREAGHSPIEKCAFAGVESDCRESA
jgi:hypothetical protein